MKVSSCPSDTLGARRWGFCMKSEAATYLDNCVYHDNGTYQDNASYQDNDTYQDNGLLSTVRLSCGKLWSPLLHVRLTLQRQTMGPRFSL